MKDWSFEEARAAQDAYMAAGGNENDPAAPFFQWAALQQIEEWRAAYEAGDTFVLLDAVAKCALRELVMPDWVIRGFLDRYRSVTQYKVRTLDEAFGTCLPKGAKLHAHRQAREKSLGAYLEVKRRHESGESIGPKLFRDVGKSMGIGESKVRDYFYYWKQVHEKWRKNTYKKTPE